MSGQNASGRIARIGRFIRLTVVQVVGIIAHTLGRGARFVESWLLDRRHAQYGLAVTRILLALTGIGLLASNFRTRLYTFGSGSAWNGEAAQPQSDFPQIGLFSLFHKLALDDTGFTLAYLVLFTLAVLLLLGWHTKLVLPVYWVGWVSFIEMNDSVGDQGDNMYRITLMALIFADTAGRWSLDARRRANVAGQTGNWLRRKWRGEPVAPGWITNLANNLVLVAVTCHTCFVYASGALFKAGGEPWRSGYAVYNPLHTARFGPWPEISDLVGTWAPIVTAVAWTSIILQMSFPMMLLNRVTRVIALGGILSFHIGIAVMMGLPWFSLSMIAIDAIFVRDVTWQAMAGGLRDLWRRARDDSPASEPRAATAVEDRPRNDVSQRQEPAEEPSEETIDDPEFAGQGATGKH